MSIIANSKTVIFSQPAQSVSIVVLKLIFSGPGRESAIGRFQTDACLSKQEKSKRRKKSLVAPSLYRFTLPWTLPGDNQFLQMHPVQHSRQSLIHAVVMVEGWTGIQKMTIVFLTLS